MTIMRPGSFAITDRGIDLAKLPKGAKVLDIGCGEGDAVAHLCTEKGMDAEGIDMNLAMVSAAKEKHPDVRVKFGDGEFLDDYSSYTFDAVMMECVLSLINIPDESLHEAYCVLKKGGRLILSDLYYKDPDPKQMRAVKIEAARLAMKPHKEGDCEEHPERFVDFRLNGVFFEKPLRAQLEEIGYRIVAFEDRSTDLDNYVAQQLMDGAKLEDLMPGLVQGGMADGDRSEGDNGGGRSDSGKSGDRRDRSGKIGYFLLVAQKPE